MNFGVKIIIGFLIFFAITQVFALSLLSGHTVVPAYTSIEDALVILILYVAYVFSLIVFLDWKKKKSKKDVWKDSLTSKGSEY